jgi:hypothetical protein
MDNHPQPTLDKQSGNVLYFLHKSKRRGALGGLRLLNITEKVIVRYFTGITGKGDNR